MANNNSNLSPIRVLMLGAGLDVKGGITSVEQLILSHTPSNIEIHHIATFAQGSSAYNIKIFLLAIFTMITKILKNESDIIHIHFSERGSTLRKIILAIIAIIFQQKLIFHAHGATYQEFYDNLPPIFQKFLASIFRKSTKFIALSKSWRNYYLEKFKLQEQQITILYNPVNLPISIPIRQDKKNLKIVFLGRIGQRGGALDLAKSFVKFPKQDKGSFDLIKAYAAIPKSEINNTELILAGNGNLEAAQQLITELNMSEKITILSWLSPEARDALLASVDIFILPSYHEGLPMSMLEAMAWGLPVIVTPVGGIPEVINDQENGLLIEPGNQEQLITAIKKLISDENLRLTIGQQGRKSVEKLDIKNYIDSLSELYNSCITKNSELINN